MTKEKFAEMLDNATVGKDLVTLLQLLPNNGKTSGHSLTMNRIMKLLCKHNDYDTKD
jgi:hypothetical protein